MKTLRQLIDNGSDHSKRTEIEAAIAAAYWAGQSDARGDERSVAAKRMTHYAATVGLGRYWRKVMEAQEAICPEAERRSVLGLSRERDEIKAWKFNL